MGLMHDIGRRVKFGFVDIPTHVYEGYKYCMPWIVEFSFDELGNCVDIIRHSV